MQHIYLTRRDLNSLLSKLDLNTPKNQRFILTFASFGAIRVIAVEDAEYYAEVAVKVDVEKKRITPRPDEPKQRYPHADEMEY
jgi:hypothetical protein